MNAQVQDQVTVLNQLATRYNLPSLAGGAMGTEEISYECAQVPSQTLDQRFQKDKTSGGY